MQFGSSRLTRSKDTGEVISLADDLKSAATDALKKCSTLLGVGLHLYADKTSSSSAETTGQKGNGGDNSQSGNGNGRLTAKQHSFLMKLSNEKGLSQGVKRPVC